MAVYSELIKNFEKIREYVRDFYIFGFHTRESFDAKSKRTYDNERRRIESWLSDHVHTSLEGHKKKVSVQVDSGNIFQNPLYQCYRSQTFTDNDIRLHFILMDALEDNAMSVSEIEAMLQLSIGCRCLRRRRRTTEMIDTGDLTMYCHWDKGLVCKKEFYCDTCEHQPAADDKENGKAEPVHIRWAEDYWSGRYPECPSCGNMPYSLERCVFCGQRFLPDALTEEWSKPPEEVRMDCPSCGGKSTMVGARARSNGHFHGQCTVCGCVVME